MTTPAQRPPLVVGIGELLWDLLPDGPRLGGAPANFAYHAHALGARVGVIARIGRDPLGEDILQRFATTGLPADWLQFDPTVPTGTVSVELDSLGIHHFQINTPAAWDQLEAPQAAMALVRSCDAVCFGSLAQRSPTAAASIRRLVAATRPDALRLFDINLRQDFYNQSTIEASLNLANALKLNDGELLELAGMFGLEGSIRRQIEALSTRYRIETIALTRGADGSLLFRRGEWSELPGGRVKIVDTIGAGDAFSAALAVGLLQGVGLGGIHRVAAELAGHVCSHAGAMPELPCALRASYAAATPGAATVHQSPPGEP